jgi:dihydropteroate synthase
MAPTLRIFRQDALTVLLSGLTDDDIALLRKILSMSQGVDRPDFGFSQPGTLAICGSPSQLRHHLGLLSAHDHLPPGIRALLTTRLDNYLRSDYKIMLKGSVLDLSARTHVMGVLNITPDSFSDGGRFTDHGQALDHARAMASEGADIIDIGGESTRPGANPLPEDEELRRVLPVIERLSEEVSVPLSIDTYKARVAERALRAGAAIVNDISGLRFSPDMGRVIADNGAAVVLMHIKGTPKNMQTDPRYDDVLGEIGKYLEESVAIAMGAGIPRDRIMIDPGIGFGKTLEHNLTILKRLDELRVLGLPIVIGTSRKRFIGTVLGISEPADRVEGTAATVALAIERGAHVVRVHDVSQMSMIARMTDAIVKADAIASATK